MLFAVAAIATSVNAQTAATPKDATKENKTTKVDTKTTTKTTPTKVEKTTEKKTETKAVKSETAPKK